MSERCPKVRVPVRRFCLVGLACAALLSGLVSPAYAGGSESGESPVVGAFGLGDDLEGAISERDGAFELGLAVGPLSLRWDSRGLADRHGLGPGWGLGFGHIDTVGGVRVARSSGGVHAADPTHPTGLAGYGVHDARFDAVSGTLDGRGAGADPVEYAFVLHELGGVVTYFNDAGDPVAQIGAMGQRSDWSWDPAISHRLLGMVDTDGVAMELDWATDPGAVFVRPGANLPPEEVDDGEPVSPTWRIELDGGRVSGIVDPAGGAVVIGYDRSGLVGRVAGRSGASTVVDWRAYPDGLTRVASVRTVDAQGRELSARTWAIAGDGSPSSGWPTYGGDAEVFWSGDAGFRYVTAVSDGATRVESEYNSLHELIDRRMISMTSSGEATLREQSFVYFGTDDGGVPDPQTLPGFWSRPVASQTLIRDPAGRERSESESFVFDELGRMVDRTAIDGTRTTTVYDDVVPEGHPLPIALQLEQTETTPDGLTRRIVHQVNDARTAVVAAESAEGRAGAPLTVTGRVEYDLRDDGFVVERRQFPTDDLSDPLRTRWDREVDLGAGTITETETVGAGTSHAATAMIVASLRHGGRLAEVGPAGTGSSTVFDVAGQPVEHHDPAGNVTRIRYENAQQHGRNVTTVTTPDGVERTERRDPLGRVIELSDNIRDGEASPGFVRIAERREYPEPGIASSTDAWGAMTTAHQDAFGRVIRTVTPTGLVQVVDHDDVANTVTTGITPTGRLADAEQTTTEQFDPVGRLVAARQTRNDGAPGQMVQHTLDGFGRAKATTDGRLTTTMTFDDVGNPVRATLTPEAEAEAEAAPGAALADRGRPITAEQRFDGFGSPIEKVIGDERRSRSGGVRSFDALGRAAIQEDQLGRATEITYTVDGLPSRIEHGNGQLTELSYDPDTREVVRVARTAPGLTPMVTEYRYDPVTRLLREQADPAGRAGTAITTDYDAFGNPTRVDYPDGAVVSYDYDPHGRRIAVTDAAGQRTEYDYDRAGVLVGARQFDASDRPSASVRYTFDEFGRGTRVARSNGVTTEYTFTSAGQIATEHTSLHDRPQSERVYEYDVRGNVTQRIDTTHDRGESVTTTTTTTTTYDYDAYDRLVRSATHDGEHADAPIVRSTTYELSPSGALERETPTEASVGETVREFDYSPLGELIATTTSALGEAGTRVEQRYDDAGNLTRAADGTEYTYDPANRPVTQSDPDGTVRQIRYWVDGARRSISERAASGETSETTFHWDGDTLLNDTTTGAGRVTTASYLIGASRHARTVIAGDRATTSYFGTDRHGNVTELTDDAGEVTTRYAYADYGARTVATLDPESMPDTNPFGYSGEYTNPDGTQHLAVRTYDPDSMRFTTMDTADLHNTYAYADLNPVTGIDPSGRTSENDSMQTLSLVLAVVGLALTVASCIFAAPVGIMKLFTVAFVIGDLLEIANYTIQRTQPDGVPGEVLEGLEQAQAGFAVVSFLGAIFGLGRFVIHAVKRGLAMFHAAEAVKVHKAATTPGLTSVSELKAGTAAANQLIADAEKGVDRVVQQYTPDALGQLWGRINFLLGVSPVHKSSQAATVASKRFWVQFRDWMSGIIGREVHNDAVWMIAKHFYEGVDAVAQQLSFVRALRLDAMRLSRMTAFDGMPAGYGTMFWYIQNLGHSVRKANMSHPLLRAATSEQILEKVSAQLVRHPPVTATESKTWFSRLWSWVMST
jgi:RHS repeat-associated protein